MRRVGNHLISVGIPRRHDGYTRANQPTTKEKSMKKLNQVIVLIGLTSTLAVTATFGQPLITVDELGKGNNNGTPLPSSMQADPFSGIVTLTYQLPFFGIRGDVQLFEPGITNNPSDVIRFDGNFHMFFFSDSTDGPPFDPADVTTLPPPIAGLPHVTMFETGPQGTNQAL